MKKNIIIYINDITLNQFVNYILIYYNYIINYINYIHSAIFTEGKKFKNIKKIKKI